MYVNINYSENPGSGSEEINYQQLSINIDENDFDNLNVKKNIFENNNLYYKPVRVEFDSNLVVETGNNAKVVIEKRDIGHEIGFRDNDMEVDDGKVYYYKNPIVDLTHVNVEEVGYRKDLAGKDGVINDLIGLDIIDPAVTDEGIVEKFIDAYENNDLENDDNNNPDKLIRIRNIEYVKGENDENDNLEDLYKRNMFSKFYKVPIGDDELASEVNLYIDIPDYVAFIAIIDKSIDRVDNLTGKIINNSDNTEEDDDTIGSLDNVLICLKDITYGNPVRAIINPSKKVSYSLVYRIESKDIGIVPCFSYGNVQLTEPVYILYVGYNKYEKYQENNDTLDSLMNDIKGDLAFDIMLSDVYGKEFYRFEYIPQSTVNSNNELGFFKIAPQYLIENVENMYYDGVMKSIVAAYYNRFSYLVGSEFSNDSISGFLYKADVTTYCRDIINNNNMCKDLYFDNGNDGFVKMLSSEYDENVPAVMQNIMPLVEGHYYFVSFYLKYGYYVEDDMVKEGLCKTYGNFVFKYDIGSSSDKKVINLYKDKFMDIIRILDITDYVLGLGEGGENHRYFINMFGLTDRSGVPLSYSSTGEGDSIKINSGIRSLYDIENVGSLSKVMFRCVCDLDEYISPDVLFENIHNGNYYSNVNQRENGVFAILNINTQFMDYLINPEHSENVKGMYIESEGGYLLKLNYEFVLKIANAVVFDVDDIVSYIDNYAELWRPFVDDDTRGNVKKVKDIDEFINDEFNSLTEKYPSKIVKYNDTPVEITRVKPYEGYVPKTDGFIINYSNNNSISDIFTKPTSN